MPDILNISIDKMVTFQFNQQTNIKQKIKQQEQQNEIKDSCKHANRGAKIHTFRQTDRQLCTNTQTYTERDCKCCRQHYPVLFTAVVTTATT